MEDLLANANAQDTHQINHLSVYSAIHAVVWDIAQNMADINPHVPLVKVKATLP